MHSEAYPWDDDGRSVVREFKRNWKGMPLRSEWNTSPLRRDCQTCTSCGYKWDEIDFTYVGAVRVNGQPPPMARHSVCWNCWMCENQPHQVRKHWESVDRANTGSQTIRKETPRLKTLGGGE